MGVMIFEAVRGGKTGCDSGCLPVSVRPNETLRRIARVLFWSRSRTRLPTAATLVKINATIVSDVMKVGPLFPLVLFEEARQPPHAYTQHNLFRSNYDFVTPRARACQQQRHTQFRPYILRLPSLRVKLLRQNIIGGPR
jgi:hypothetical protein